MKVSEPFDDLHRYCCESNEIKTGVCDMRFYEVLKNGRSFHGRSFNWSLPTDGVPGKWHRLVGNVVPCHHGFHITTEPALWMDVAADVFEVEVVGEPLNCDKPDKFVCGEIRLLKKLSVTELEKLQIFSEGEHTISVGKAFAFGSAKLSVRGSSSAVLWGSSLAVKWSANAKQSTEDSAIVIDRSTPGKPKIIGEHQRENWKYSNY